MQKLFLVIVMGMLAQCIAAQDFSNKGKDFWIAYGNHVNMFNNKVPIPSENCSTSNNGIVCPEKMQIYITSDVSTTGMVEIPSVGFSKPFTVIANQITTIDIPRAAALGDEGLYDHGIHVTANSAVVVYSFIYVSAVSSAALCLPTTVLGRSYYSINYTQISNANNSYSYFDVVATEDNTSVDITPSQNTKGGRLANATFSVALNKGQIYQVLADADLTGSKIQSVSGAGGGCKRIAVFAGSGKISIGCSLNASSSVSSDNLYQQVYPTSSWGKKYITTPSTNDGSNMQYNFFRIIRPDTTAVVKLNGTIIPSTNFANKFYYEFYNNTTNVIESDKPIMVAQYFTTASSNSGANCGNSGDGDPEMIYLNSVEQTLNKVTLNSMQPATGTNLTIHFVNIVLSNTPGAINSFKIDGAAYGANFLPLPQDPNYAYARISVRDQGHTITCDSGFNAIAYGFGRNESYGYSAGSNVRDLYQYVTLQNKISSINFPATCKNTPSKFSLTLSYQPLSMRWSFSDNPAVSPAWDVVNNAPSFDSSFIKDGRRFYVYNLSDSIRFLAAGSFPLKVTVDNPTADGCSGIQEIDYDVVVYEKPAPNFLITHNTCVADSVHFADATIAGGRPITQYAWAFGDNTIDSIKNPVKLYTSVGTSSYGVKLTTINDIGCVADTTITLPMHAMPEANFNFPTLLCQGATIAFSDASTISDATVIQSWQWTFDDPLSGASNSDNLQNTVHLFKDANTYSVGLKVLSDKGCASNTVYKSVLVNAQPKAGFIVPQVCLSDGAALFTDTSSIGNPGVILSHAWQFSNGNPATSALKNPSIAYTTTGLHPVSLTVVATGGCSDTLQQNFFVNGSNPVANFIVNNAAALCATDSVAISNTSAVSPGNITKVEIYWDNTGAPTAVETDDFPFSNKVYKHIYPSFQSPLTKDYPVRVVAYSGGVCLNEVTKNITLLATPKVQFLALPNSCLDAAPYLITQATELGNLPGSYQFSGAGVSASGLFNPALAGVGTHKILYTFTTTAGGCVDTASQLITVLAPAIANFEVSNPSCATQSIYFTSTSTSPVGTLTSYEWNFGDGTAIEIKNNPSSFAHVFTAAINAIVSLKVTTSDGCVSAPYLSTLSVHPLPKPDFSFPPVACLPAASVAFTNLSTISDGTENAFTYRWNFGDALSGLRNTDVAKNPVHNFSVLGNYPIQLKVTSGDGCVHDTLITLNTIHPQPRAQFSIDKPSICLGDMVQFTDQSTGADGTVTSWHWNFGDNQTALTATTPHLYNSDATYPVSLFITNSIGCNSDTLSKSFTVYPLPSVSAGPDRVLLEGGSIILQPIVSGNDLQYQWSPNLYINPSSGATPMVKDMPNDVTYTLLVTARGNCSAKDDVVVRLLKAPKIPNTFSPNNDGINDHWLISYLDSYPNCHLKVFTKSGQMVYETKGYSDATAWDGNYRGKSLPVDTYYYILEPGSGRQPITGFVTIIK